MDSKGQGLSLNVIIIAALALIVLVVLVVIFTGRIGIFEQGVSKEADTELVKLKIRYGNCHPGAASEVTFRTQFAQAGGDAVLEEAAKDTLALEITRCRDFADQAACSAGACNWG